MIRLPPSSTRTDTFCPDTTLFRSPSPSETGRAGAWQLASGAPPRRARATSLSRATKCKPLGRAGMTGLRSVDPPASKQGGCRPALSFLRRQSVAAAQAAAGDAVEGELHRHRRQQPPEPTRGHVQDGDAEEALDVRAAKNGKTD